MGDVLSPLDSLFLHLESPRTPMHMGSIGIFEGAPFRAGDGCIRIEELRRRVMARLALVPKLLQRPSPSPFLVLPRRWQDDPAFDVSAHVRQAAVPPPGREEDLLELCAELMSGPLSRARPLWELWIVEGLQGGRVAVVEKLHHSLSDGLGGVELASILLDLERHPRQPVDVPRWRPQRPASLAALTGEDLGTLARDAARRAAHRIGALAHPARALGTAGDVVDGLRSLLRPSPLAPHCSLNVPIGRRRRVAVVRERLSALQEVEHRAGVTVNDVLLTAVAGGMRALHESRGERLHDLHVMVPVGMDHAGDGTLGNAVSTMVVRLPLDVGDPGACLARVAAATAEGKRHHQTQGALALLSTLGAGLQPGIGAVAAMVQHQPFVNVVVTNVPGPRTPLYAMGARMLEAIPIVPIAGNLSVGIAAFSYQDRFTVGILADRDAGADVDVLARGMARTFRALVRGARDTGAVSPTRSGPAARRVPTAAHHVRAS